jgi:hypothetical protein
MGSWVDGSREAAAVYDGCARAYGLVENNESRWQKWTAEHGVDFYTMLLPDRLAK